jgi:hypothetical protein
MQRSGQHTLARQKKYTKKENFPIETHYEYMVSLLSFVNSLQNAPIKGDSDERKNQQYVSTV